MRRRSQRTETPVEVEGHHLTLVNLEKVMYPRTGTTKAEVLNYYAQVAPVMLPHLADRAVTRIRWPHGTSEQSFFEKNVPGGTPSLGAHRRRCRPRARAPSPARRASSTFPIIDSLADPHLAGQPRLARAARAPVDGHEERASRATPTGWSIDLDPGEPAGLGECCAGRAAGPRPARRGRPGLRPGDQRVEGPAPVRRPRRQAHLRGGARLRQGDRRGARRPSTPSWWSRR